MLDNLHAQITTCTNCSLHKLRTNAVPGEGNPKSGIVIIGEAPGHWEDVQGKPFVGRSGKLLDKTLNGVGLDRTKVFITNIVKCRPPENRRPSKDETETCSTYINQQLELMAPRVIMPLGNTAGEWLFKKYGLDWPGATKANGQSYEVSTLFGKLTILPAFHPAAILRNPNRTEDFQAVFTQLKALI
ncbi:MAG: uracil-DNA glycosylase [Candidatus Altiarchaeota archaeon]|nr:uracil-DNA glycosylase [Candidatus Altiarchaeota archaeon]